MEALAKKGESVYHIFEGTFEMLLLVRTVTAISHVEVGFRGDGISEFGLLKRFNGDTLCFIDTTDSWLDFLAVRLLKWLDNTVLKIVQKYTLKSLLVRTKRTQKRLNNVMTK